MKTLLKKALIVLAVVYTGAITYLYFNQENLIFHPAPQKDSLETFGLSNTNEITLKVDSEDALSIQAWYRKPDAGKQMVLFYHGNTGCLEQRVRHLKVLAERGYGFLIPSWRGFGKSEGRPSKNGLLEDAKTAITFLEEEGFKTEDTVLIGESLGTAMAVNMAYENDFKAILLITPYTSMAKIAQGRYPFIPAELVLKHNFDAISYIDDIDEPIMIIHGTADTVIPHQHAEELFSKIKPETKKKFILYPGMNHVGYDFAKVMDEMEKFMDFSLAASN